MMKSDVRSDASDWPTTQGDLVARVLPVGPMISWRAILAGGLVGGLVYLALTALGIALGGLGMEQAIEEGGGGGALSLGAGIWMLLSAIVSLFIGGFIAARASGVIPTRIGGIEGLVVAALFFLVLLMGLTAGLGVLGRGASSLLGSAGRGVLDLAQNTQVQSVVEQALGGLDLRSDPAQVARGVAVRLLQGNEDAATTYLAREAGIPPEQADQRLQQIRAQVSDTARTVGQGAARATQVGGWILFVTVLLGGAAALWGGAYGARRNLRRPVSERDRQMALESRTLWYGPGESTTRTGALPPS